MEYVNIYWFIKFSGLVKEYYGGRGGCQEDNDVYIGICYNTREFRHRLSGYKETD
jgi:hypothetical protein